jgi:hypothetical protein
MMNADLFRRRLARLVADGVLPAPKRGKYMATKKVGAVGGDVSNDAAPDIQMGVPYQVELVLSGTAPMLFHRWSCDAVDEKAKAAKGSKAKKSDNVESYVYRNEDGDVCLPGEYIRQSILHAAKFRQDPRSPRKSAFDLYKAGVVALTELCSLGVKDWDYLDRRRVVIQRNAVTRERPAMRQGWKATCQLMILVPEYISLDDLSDVLTNAGRLVGVGDFRPTFGRFRVEKFAVLDLSAAA